MKILFVLEYYYPNIGGVERLFKSLTEHLVSSGNEVTVITNRFDKKLKKREYIKGVFVRRLNFRNRFLFTFFSLPWVFNYSRNKDLIHTTSYNAALPSFFAAKLLGKKVIITFHEAWGKLWFKLPFINPLSKLLFYLYEQMIIGFRFHKFIAVSEYTKDCLINTGVNKDRIVRIYNGLVYPGFLWNELQGNNDFIFTFFGRLGPSKGIDILIKASMKFLKENSDARLRLIITKKPKSILRYIHSEIQMNSLNEQVEIFHHLPDEELRKKLLSSSCVVIPSISEGFCFAAAETIALGVPLVSSDMGALKEVVSGKHIKMRDYSVNMLVETLEKAKNSDWEKTEVKRFELSDTLNDYKNLYNKLNL